jgi:hypothetical protein
MLLHEEEHAERGDGGDDGAGGRHYLANAKRPLGGDPTSIKSDAL